ncbi:hypothetical protein OTU49_014404, partial [Cherax quadricarinatus]
PGTLIPSTVDCSIYKVCLASDVIEEECPSDHQYFDFKTGDCSDDPTVCYETCDPCDVYCVTEGKIPNPHNCYGYLYCNPPDVAVFLCPDGEVFNPDTLICESTTDPCENSCTDTTGAYDDSWDSFLE